MAILRASCLLAALLFITFVCANVEKVVFVARGSLGDPAHAFLDTLNSPYIERLAPSQPSLRRRLHAGFGPSSIFSEPSEAWILLDQLQPGCRYEVRICWSASQPTSFDLSVHDLLHFSEAPTALVSLKRYLSLRNRIASPLHKRPDIHPTSDPNSMVFYVSAKAEYYSNDRALMTEGLLVDVDITLDPYLLNIFPRSLVPTAAYLCGIALGAWFIASALTNFLHGRKSNPSSKVPSAKKTA